MSFSKEQKYKYKFLKSVINKNYDGLYGYMLKYLEHSNNSYIINSFNEINNRIQTGGAEELHNDESTLLNQILLSI